MMHPRKVCRVREKENSGLHVDFTYRNNPGWWQWHFSKYLWKNLMVIGFNFPHVKWIYNNVLRRSLKCFDMAGVDWLKYDIWKPNKIILNDNTCKIPRRCELSRISIPNAFVAICVYIFSICFFPNKTFFLFVFAGEVMQGLEMTLALETATWPTSARGFKERVRKHAWPPKDVITGRLFRLLIRNFFL